MDIIHSERKYPDDRINPYHNPAGVEKEIEVVVLPGIKILEIVLAVIIILRIYAEQNLKII